MSNGTTSSDASISIASMLKNALAHHEAGDLDRAEPLYDQILRIDPAHADALHLRGVAAHQRKNDKTAVELIERAIRVNDATAVYHANLGAACWSLGDVERAVACYHEAIRLAPDWAEAHANLATVFLDAAQLDQARTHYERALSLDGNIPLAWNNLGNVLIAQGEHEEAVRCYRRAIQLQPDYAEPHNNLAQALRDQGLLNEAAASFWRAARIKPEKTLWNLRIATLCPVVFENNEAIDRYRRTLAAQLKQFAERRFSIELAELAESGAQPPFQLLFHGRDNRAIKEAYATILGDRLPQIARVAERSGIPKVGFVVTAGHEDACLTSLGGILKRLDTSTFQPVIVCSRKGSRKLANSLAGGSIDQLVVRERFDQAAETIAEAGFDVLYHWEPGTDATNYFLPFLRLAPVQCTSWGIPDTSGIAAIDYYLTSALVEIEDAQIRYSEQLIAAPSLLTWQGPASGPIVHKNRDDFGLPSRRNLYVCVQQLRKYHPDFDDMLANILRTDPAGLIVAVADRCGTAAEQLRHRYARHLPDVADRIVFLPWQAYSDYMSLLALADVVLDTVHCGGGFTTFDAFSLGKAIVTLPSPFRRGRFALACYGKMGIEDCIANDANDYARIAIRLATDAPYRQAIEERIRRRASVLFDDGQAVRDYQQILERLVAEARTR